MDGARHGDVAGCAGASGSGIVRPHGSFVASVSIECSKRLCTAVGVGLAQKTLDDYDLMRRWSKDVAKRARARRFGRFVYLPVPWHHVVEQYGMLRRDTTPLRLLAAILRRLDFEQFDHFITIGQASLEQAERYARRAGFELQI